MKNKGIYITDRGFKKIPSKSEKIRVTRVHATYGWGVCTRCGNTVKFYFKSVKDNVSNGICPACGKWFESA